MHHFRQIAALLLCGVALATAQVQSFGERGEVHWGQRTLVAKGIGAPNPAMPAVAARPMAIQAARSIALRNALELIQGIQLNSSVTVEEQMVTNDAIRTEVRGYIARFKESAPRYMSDKTVEITVEIPIDHQLSEILLRKEISDTPRISTTSQKKGGIAHYTGMIIDARNLETLPALTPKIFNESGKEIFGPSYANRAAAVKWGITGYALTVEEARAAVDRIGSQPAQFKAVRSSGNSKSDLILSNADAHSIEAAAQFLDFLTECRVIIVVD